MSRLKKTHSAVDSDCMTVEIYVFKKNTVSENQDEELLKLAKQGIEDITGYEVVLRKKKVKKEKLTREEQIYQSKECSENEIAEIKRKFDLLERECGSIQTKLARIDQDNTQMIAKMADLSRNKEFNQPTLSDLLQRKKMEQVRIEESLSVEEEARHNLGLIEAIEMSIREKEDAQN